MTGIRSFLQKLHNTVIPLTDKYLSFETCPHFETQVANEHLAC